MATPTFSGAALLIAAHRATGDAGEVVGLLGQLGETLLAASGRWWIRRLSPLDSDRLAPSRANLKLALDDLAGRELDTAMIVIAGELAGDRARPALVTGPLHAEYPDDASLPLAWIRDRLASLPARRTVVVVSVRGTAADRDAALAALATARPDHLIAVDHGDHGDRAIGALLVGLAGAAHDPRTGTITLRSLSAHLAGAARGLALQRSDDAETVAMVAPLGGPWGGLATRRPTAPAAGPDDLTGVVLPGRFRLDAVLASGSFGTVYRARQLSVDRDVAVKVLHADIDPSSEDGRLFLHEIQAVGRIDHGGVARIFQADLAPGGRLFFAMELVDGRDLQRLIDGEGRVAPARAIALTLQLLAALGAAHDAGLVHADVKPGNLLIAGAPPDERLVLVDFGMARLRPPNQAAESVGGTPSYMAPEQLRDGRVDARSDLCAAGLVLVTLLTGWFRTSADELIPPLDDIADARLRATLARACALDPAARFQTAGDFARALTGDAAAAIEPPPPRSPFRHLAPFTEHDHDRLHGRDRDLAALVEQVLFRRAVVYTAPSGTGKTSLLRAGLVPRLTSLGVRAIYLPSRADSRAALIDALGGGDDLAGALAAWARREGGRLAVILDQLETALTAGPDGAEADPLALARELLALEAGADQLAVVLSVREDFLGRLLAADERLRSGVPVVRLPPLERAGARAAISEALTEHRVEIDGALLDALLDDLETAARALGPEMGWEARPAVYPPHLQLACSVLYETLPAGATTLTLDHYRRLGGFDAIVGEYLDRVLESELDDDAARIARDLFVALVTAAHTRAFRSEADLLELGDPAAIRAVLAALAGRGLLMRVRGADGEFGWELIHDSLVPRVQAWLDRRDLSRRRAIELLRHHVRRSADARPSLLAAGELRELRGHAAAIDELDADWQRRGATWTPRRLIAHSRAVARRRLAGLATAATVLVTVGAVAIARWSAERDRRRHEQSLRDRDQGRFTLELHPFDRDPATGAAIPVSAAELPALTWRLVRWPADDDVSFTPLEVRRGTPHVLNGGALAETIEARGGRAYLVVDGRGRPGETCPPSLVPMAQLPGYASRGAEPPSVPIQVPICGMRSGVTVTIAAGPFERGGQGTPPTSEWDDNADRIERTILELPEFAIDRTEVTNQAFSQFASMAGVTGIAIPPYPRTKGLEHAGAPDRPVSGLLWHEGRAYCRWLGGDLPTSEQWEKTMRGGLTLPDGTANPVSDRNLPWGTADLDRANLMDSRTDNQALAVGSMPGDISPYGVVDLAGNVQEWTRSILSVGGTPEKGARITRGANWDDALSKDLVVYVAMENSRAIDSRYFMVGMRCAYGTSARNAAGSVTR